MSKKSFLVDCLLLALIFVSVVGAFIAFSTTRSIRALPLVQQVLSFWQ